MKGPKRDRSLAAERRSELMIKEYHSPGGEPVSVNLASIAYVQPSANQTLITFIGGNMLNRRRALRRGLRHDRG